MHYRQCSIFWSTREQQGVLPDTILQMANLDAVWAEFVASAKGTANVTADHFLTYQGAVPNAHFGPTPTRNGLPTTVATTWAFAILTTDETQRKLALDLMSALLAPSVQGEWSQYAHYLPSRRSSFDTWSNDDYVAFLHRQMEVAVALPNGLAFAEFAAPLAKRATRFAQRRIDDPRRHPKRPHRAVNPAKYPLSSCQRLAPARSKFAASHLHKSKQKR